jgi:hypothetical protein
MTHQTDDVILMFERQLLLLRELVCDLLLCRTDYASMSLEEIYWHLAEQASLCDQFRRFQIERPRSWVEAGQETIASENQINDWMSPVGSEISRSLQRVFAEISLTEGHSRHLNRVQETLLDGSRRTLNLLANAVAILNAQPAEMLVSSLNPTASIDQLTLFSN